MTAKAKINADQRKAFMRGIGSCMKWNAMERHTAGDGDFSLRLNVIII